MSNIELLYTNKKAPKGESYLAECNISGNTKAITLNAIFVFQSGSMRVKYTLHEENVSLKNFKNEYSSFYTQIETQGQFTVEDDVEFEFSIGFDNCSKVIKEFQDKINEFLSKIDESLNKNLSSTKTTILNRISPTRKVAPSSIKKGTVQQVIKTNKQYEGVCECDMEFDDCTCLPNYEIMIDNKKYSISKNMYNRLKNSVEDEVSFETKKGSDSQIADIHVIE
jgi:hypothetical protein